MMNPRYEKEINASTHYINPSFLRLGSGQSSVPSSQPKWPYCNLHLFPYQSKNTIETLQGGKVIKVAQTAVHKKIVKEHRTEVL